MWNFQTQRRLSTAERHVCMGDENKIAVEVVRVCRLRLDSDFFFVLDLNETLYVPSF